MILCLFTSIYKKQKYICINKKQIEKRKKSVMLPAVLKEHKALQDMAVRLPLNIFILSMATRPLMHTYL